MQWIIHVVQEPVLTLVLCSVVVFIAFHDSEVSVVVVFFYNVAQHTMHPGQNWVFNILTKGSILSVRF